eukprot:ANDGO_06779.mRNA.1 hypothetical protein
MSDSFSAVLDSIAAEPNVSAVSVSDKSGLLIASRGSASASIAAAASSIASSSHDLCSAFGSDFHGAVVNGKKQSITVNNIDHVTVATIRRR